jgi:hypothetical protein
LTLCADLDTLGGATVFLPLPVPGHDDEKHTRRLETVLRRLADLTAPFETRLALTPLPGEGDLAPALTGAAEAVERAGRPNLGLGLDLTRGPLPTEIPARHVRRLWAVRLGGSWTPDQQGQLRALCAQLASAGYQGPYSVAPMPGTSLAARARTAKAALDVLIG